MTAVGQAHTRSASFGSARWRATARWVIGHPDALALGAVGVICAVLTAMTWHRWGGIGTDSGYDIAAGTRVAHGHLPYVDFVYYYGPLAPLLLGLIFWVGGASITSSVVLGLVVGVAILVATYLLARQLLGPFAAFVVTSLTAAIGFSPNEFGFVLPYSYDDALGLLFVLVLCLEIIRFARTSRRSHLVACGIALGLAGLAKPEFLLAGLGGVALWLLLRWRDGALRRGDLIALVVPAAAVMSAMYGYFLARVSLHALLFENLYPRAEIKAAVDTTLRSRAPLTLASLGRKRGGSRSISQASVLCCSLGDSSTAHGGHASRGESSVPPSSAFSQSRSPISRRPAHGCSSSSAGSRPAPSSRSSSSRCGSAGRAGGSTRSRRAGSQRS